MCTAAGSLLLARLPLSARVNIGTELKVDYVTRKKDTEGAILISKGMVELPGIQRARLDATPRS